MGNNNSYKLNNIILSQSTFERNNMIDSSDEIINALNIDVENTVKNEIVLVKLIVTLTGKSSDTGKDNFDFKVSYVGEWSMGENPQPPLEIFTKMNAPAIIFPFIREHIAGISLKAGLDPLFLPTINFSQAAKEKNNDISKNED